MAVILRCEVCGTDVPDTETENARHAEAETAVRGLGLCRRCCDPATRSLRRKLGPVNVAYYDGRISTVRRRLSPEKAGQFDRLPFRQQVEKINQLVKAGKLR